MSSGTVLTAANLRTRMLPTGGTIAPGALLDFFETVMASTKSVGGATMTVGAEAANVINVAIQFHTEEGDSEIAQANAIPWYLSADSAGQTIGTAHSSAPAIGTDGLLILDGGDSAVSGLLICEADGDADIDFTDTGTGTVYLNLVMPNGTIVTSDAITHT